MTNLKPGDKAPFFEGTDQQGHHIKLSDFKGKKLILYFYPKDNTPGCTAEACNLRDHYKELLDNGFSIVGVSPDSEKSHQNFAKKYNPCFHQGKYKRSCNPNTGSYRKKRQIVNFNTV